MYALVLIDISSSKIGEIQRLQLLENIQGDMLPNEGLKKLLENVWPIDVEQYLTIFCDMLVRIRKFGLSYKVSFFENEPKFTE
jgi:hypothetical protein